MFALSVFFFVFFFLICFVFVLGLFLWSGRWSGLREKPWTGFTFLSLVVGFVPPPLPYLFSLRILRLRFLGMVHGDWDTKCLFHYLKKGVLESRPEEMRRM